MDNLNFDPKSDNFFGKVGNFLIDRYTDFADAFGIGSARRDRQFQEHMSNTAYQRAVQDMKKAGLNPALAVNSGMQASTPRGSSSGVGSASGNISSAVKLIDILSKLAR